jgi:voltage-gated potassium channel
MVVDLVFWMGLNGAPPGEPVRVYALEKRLHPLMIGIALLAVPSFYLEELQPGHPLRSLGALMDALIFGAFALETLAMLMLSRQRLRYLQYNWLNLFIVLASGLALMGLDSEWIPLVRLARAAFVGLVFARMLSGLRRMVAANAVAYAFALGTGAVLLAGLGFYWLEPSAHTFDDGLWLAFTTAATIGYGDIVPTTTASRLLAVLVVVVGYAVFSLVTASVAAFLIGEGERRMQHEIYRDMKALRGELAELRGQLASLQALAGSHAQPVVAPMPPASHRKSRRRPG